MSEITNEVLGDCPKCGGKEISHQYRATLQRWDVDSDDVDRPSKFINRITFYTREASRECITHHCRICHYDWQTSPLRRKKAIQ